MSFRKQPFHASVKSLENRRREKEEEGEGERSTKSKAHTYLHTAALQGQFERAFLCPLGGSARDDRARNCERDGGDAADDLDLRDQLLGGDDLAHLGKEMKEGERDGECDI